MLRVQTCSNELIHHVVAYVTMIWIDFRLPPHLSSCWHLHPRQNDNMWNNTLLGASSPKTSVTWRAGAKKPWKRKSDACTVILLHRDFQKCTPPCPPPGHNATLPCCTGLRSDVQLPRACRWPSDPTAVHTPLRAFSPTISTFTSIAQNSLSLRGRDDVRFDFPGHDFMVESWSFHQFALVQ